MLLSNELETDAARAAWERYSDTTEATARVIGACLDRETTVTIGPVIAQKDGRRVFDIKGALRSGSPFSLGVTIPNSIPEGDTWLIWCYSLRDAGLAVCEDAAYEQMLMDAEPEDTLGSIAA